MLLMLLLFFAAIERRALIDIADTAAADAAAFQRRHTLCYADGRCRRCRYAMPRAFRHRCLSLLILMRLRCYAIDA